MSSPGKYVRAPVNASDSESNYDDAGRHQASSPGRFVRVNFNRHSDEVRTNSFDHYDSVVDSDSENRKLRQKVSELERIISELADARNCSQTDNNAPESSISAPVAMTSESSISCIRWDNIKQFPKGTPANKIWEAWTKFIENFEVAASLSNAHDPIKRSQLLYISVGEELQAIIRAAKLQPDTKDPGCYVSFVKNIDTYLKSLTDTSAEHDAFLAMKQEIGESAVNFYARLMEKVWLCDYSPPEQQRFVRTQLIRGLRNRDLAKAARIFGHETNFIVQSSTRDEAFQTESVPPEDSEVLAVSQKYSRSMERRIENETNSSGWNASPATLRALF